MWETWRLHCRVQLLILLRRKWWDIFRNKVHDCTGQSLWKCFPWSLSHESLTSLFVMRSYFFNGIRFIESRFYWSPFFRNICTESSTNNYLFKVNNKNTRTSWELSSKLTTKTSGRCHCSRSDVFIFNFEH